LRSNNGVANLRSSNWIRRLSVDWEKFLTSAACQKAFVFSHEDGRGQISTIKGDVPHDISVHAAGGE